MAAKAPQARSRPFLLILILAAVALSGVAVLAWRLAVSGRTRVHERSALAMGTYVNLRAAGPRAPAALDSAMAEIGRLDVMFSYHAPEGDVWRLNRAAGQGPVAVSEETVELLELALHYADVSGGRFDPTVGPLVDVWGFRPDREPAVPGPAELEDALARVGYRDLRVNREAGTAELLRPGMAVDLGGIAKGYVIDRIVGILRAGGVESAILDVGGNVYALGPRPDGRAWRVGLQHPRDDGALLGILPLTDASIATSGDYQRFFTSGEQRYHHIIDPAGGYPGTGVAAISIVARSAVEGDAVSTAAFLFGPDGALEFVRSLGLEAILYTAGGRLEVTPGLEGDFEAKVP